MVAAVGLGIPRQESIVVVLIECRAVSRIRVLREQTAGMRVSRNDGLVEQLNRLCVRISNIAQIAVRVERQRGLRTVGADDCSRVLLAVALDGRHVVVAIRDRYELSSRVVSE